MKFNQKRFIFLLLAAELVATTVACSSQGSGNGSETTAGKLSDTTSAMQTETAESEKTENILEARKNVKDTLPDNLDFGGREFRIIGSEYNIATDAWVEDENGDLINDAVYERNRSVEERLNCKIPEPYMDTDYTAISKNIINSVKAGDDAYDLDMGHAIQTAEDAMQGVFVNWYDIPNVDFKQPWYPQNVIDRITVDGKMLVAVSDIALSTVSDTWCMFYNKSLAAQYDLPDIYALVDSGEWTIDKLTELTKDIYTDLNNDGKKDKDDFYGFESDLRSSTDTYWWAFDQPIVEVKNGEINLTFGSEKSSAILDKLVDVFYNYQGIIGYKDFNIEKGNFEDQKCIFVNDVLGCADGDFRAMEDFGIIPFPKWDTDQEAYYTLPDGSYSALAVPQTASDHLDFVGAVVEALSAESWKSVIPTYYQVVLKDKQLRDEDSIRMLDLILDGRSIDFGYMYDGWKGFAYAPEQLVQNKTKMASYYASKEKSVGKYYESVLKVFQDYGK